jgi:amino acid transporter
MSRFLPWLLFFSFALCGWFISRRRPEPARKLARGLAIAPAIILLILVASGWLRPVPTVAEVHRWSGHALAIAMWLAVPLAIGVTLQRQRGKKFGGAVLLVLALGISLLASFTGYLDTSQAGEETKNRFIILHFYALPIALATLLAAWTFIFRPRRRVSE